MNFFHPRGVVFLCRFAYFNKIARHAPAMLSLLRMRSVFPPHTIRGCIRVCETVSSTAFRNDEISRTRKFNVSSRFCENTYFKNKTDFFHPLVCVDFYCTRAFKALLVPADPGRGGPVGKRGRSRPQVLLPCEAGFVNQSPRLCN